VSSTPWPSGGSPSSSVSINSFSLSYSYQMKRRSLPDEEENEDGRQYPSPPLLLSSLPCLSQDAPFGQCACPLSVLRFQRVAGSISHAMTSCLTNLRRLVRAPRTNPLPFLGAYPPFPSPCPSLVRASTLSQEEGLESSSMTQSGSQPA
jgi:hypothetical protein